MTKSPVGVATKLLLIISATSVLITTVHQSFKSDGDSRRRLKGRIAMNFGDPHTLQRKAPMSYRWVAKESDLEPAFVMGETFCVPWNVNNDVWEANRQRWFVSREGIEGRCFSRIDTESHLELAHGKGKTFCVAWNINTGIWEANHPEWFLSREGKEARCFSRTETESDVNAAAASRRNTFQKVWPQLQEELCPNMKPNVKIGNALFSLARNEMAKGKFSFPVNRFGSDPEMVKLFYSGLFLGGGAVYYPPQNAPLLYHLRIWKCANNQIRDWMRTTLFESLGGQVIDKTSLKAVPRWNDLEQIQKPCIVTAIRDPISHFLSGYNEIEMRLPNKPPQEFKLAPGVLPFANAAEGGSIDRFQSFVNDLLGEKEIFKKWVDFQHVFPMMRVLPVLAGEDKPLTAYLPSLSNLTFTWPRFVAKACPSMPQKVANIGMQLGGQHESSQDPHGYYQAAKNVWNEGGPAARALCILHALDYACWRDLPDGVPELCQRVFVSPPFVSTVLSTL